LKGEFLIRDLENPQGNEQREQLVCMFIALPSDRIANHSGVGDNGGGDVM